MGSDSIKKDLSIFQTSIKKLSQGIGKAGTLWSDSKYSELAEIVSNIANQSKEVIVTGDSCCTQIDKFEKISSEEY